MHYCPKIYNKILQYSTNQKKIVRIENHKRGNI